jgi:hypothetical protein
MNAVFARLGGGAWSLQANGRLHVADQVLAWDSQTEVGFAQVWPAIAAGSLTSRSDLFPSLARSLGVTRIGAQ